MTTQRKSTNRASSTGTPSTADLIAHDLRIPVPDGPKDDPGAQQVEDEAVLTSPAFQARPRRAQANKRAGRGISAADMDRYLADPETREYSGSLRVRMPKHLHRDLARQAEQDGVSLNTLIVALLERGMGAVDRGSVTVPASAPIPRHAPGTAGRPA